MINFFELHKKKTKFDINRNRYCVNFQGNQKHYSLDALIRYKKPLIYLIISTRLLIEKLIIDLKLKKKQFLVKPIHSSLRPEFKIDSL